MSKQLILLKQQLPGLIIKEERSYVITLLCNKYVFLSFSPVFLLVHLLSVVYAYEDDVKYFLLMWKIVSNFGVAL